MSRHTYIRLDQLLNYAGDTAVFIEYTGPVPDHNDLARVLKSLEHHDELVNALSWALRRIELSCPKPNNAAYFEARRILAAVKQRRGSNE